MACVYLKQKLSNTLWCKKHNVAVDILQCMGCKDLEYKKVKLTLPKKATFRLIEKQKNRFSIIYRDLTKCAICGSKQVIELNEVYEGGFNDGKKTCGHGQVLIGHGLVQTLPLLEMPQIFLHQIINQLSPGLLPLLQIVMKKLSL